MSDYLTNSICRGRIPHFLGGSKKFLRSDLLAKMIRQRNTARFIIAPPLFGKSSVAAEYAESVFSFENVFWFPANSHCFLRDLDQKAFLPFMIKKHMKPCLAVFQDLPYLDEKRADILSDVFDELLKHGWEVVVTMTPRCNVFAERQPDALCICVEDLLLSDIEVDARRSSLEKTERRATDYLPSERIPGLFWTEENAEENFLKAIIKEELAVDERLMIFVMLILEKGELENLGMFVRGWNAGLLERLLADYPYLGIDAYRQEFETYPFSLKSITKAFAPSLNGMVAHSNYAGKGELIFRLADYLIVSGSTERACQVIAKISPPAQRLIWLEQRSHDLFEKGSLLPVHQLYESIKKTRERENKYLTIEEAWRLVFLGDEERAVRVAMRLSQFSDTTLEVRAFVALLLARFGNKTQQQKSLVVMKGLCHYQVIKNKNWDSESFAASLVAERQPWKILIQGQLCLRYKKDEAIGFVESSRLAGAPHDTLTLLVIWLIEEVSASAKGDMQDEKKWNTTSAVHYASTYLENRSHDKQISFLDHYLFWQLETLKSIPAFAEIACIPQRMLSPTRKMEVFVLEQKNYYLRMSLEKPAGDLKPKRIQDNEYRKNSLYIDKVEDRVPPLHVKLFGGLEVRIGDKVLDPRLLSRQKIKILLALLAINQGKEFPRKRLCEVLWEGSDLIHAQRNLYSMWSMLKKALALPSGNCPYLVHTQFSYKMDGKNVSSDVTQFDSLCRKLILSASDLESWAQAYIEISDIYPDDLLPCETENRYISQMRFEYRTRLVDSLASAAYRLFEKSEYQATLWFARAAIMRDSAREDMYVLLMQTQVALGQRAAALETYFRCRKYLVEEMGIDPSEKTMTLYTDIITEDPALKSKEPLLLATNIGL